MTNVRRDQNTSPLYASHRFPEVNMPLRQDGECGKHIFTYVTKYRNIDPDI